MKQLFTICLAICMFSLHAQHTSAIKTKAPLWLQHVTQNIPAGTIISILVKGEPNAVAEAAKQHGGMLVYHTGTICSVQIPVGELHSFSLEEAVIEIGNAPVKMQPLNDTLKIQSRINDVHNGLSPLPQSYNGDSIVVGMIDSGIDFNHPDFKDSQGNTRILYIWDQEDNNGPGPAPWNYGTVWDSAQINANLCTHDDLQHYGHGTHVTGIAAGNGLSTNAANYAGAAPKSKIIMVALDFSGFNSPTAVADAAAFIYAKAQALGLPCVINASVGDYYGSHDGKDLQALMIDSLLDTPSRVFVTASGNAGNLPIHLSYSLSADTNITFFNTTGSIYLQVWADTNNFNGAQMAVGCTRNTNWTDVDRIGFTNIQQNMNLLTTDTLFNSSGQRIAFVQRISTIQAATYSMEFLIFADSTSGYEYSLQLTGSGNFHLWSFDISGTTLPSQAQYPAIVYYKNTDTISTICSSFQCSDRVITVGNFVNRRGWTNVNNVPYNDNTVIAGSIMYNSSVGPTRDGRNKPDITAPGANDISCAVISMLPAIISGAPDAVGIGGYHVVGGGTSASAPVVAGSVALWLESYPTGDWQTAKNAVIYCAIQDGYTGSNLPDNTWGYGKVDAYSMIVNCGPNSVNQNENPVTETLTVYPNPTGENQTVNLNFAAVSSMATMQVYNMQGQVIYTENVRAGSSQLQFSTSRFAAGNYLIVLRTENEVLKTNLIVE
jgi:subtilisin family serine protease